MAAKSKKKLNRAAVALSARRMVKLSPERRKAIASAAAKARWGKKASPVEAAV